MFWKAFIVQTSRRCSDVCRAIGRVIHTNAILYDWCYDFIEPQLKYQFILQMESLATKLEVIWPKLVPDSIVGHGVEAQLSRDMLACGVATYDKKPEIYKLVPGTNTFSVIYRFNQLKVNRTAVQGLWTKLYVNC